jgi:ABC-2 type transport system permease protein
VNAFRALTRNVVRSALRNRVAMFFSLGLAVFFMVIFGLLFGGNGAKLQIGIVDGDNSARSHQVADTLKQIDGVTVDQGDAAHELDRLKHSDVDIVVQIPAGFGQATRANPVHVTVTQGVATSQGASIADQIVASVISRVAGGGGQAVVVDPPQLAAVNHITNIDYFLPGMIAYIILQSGINYVAIGVVELRVRRVLRRLRVTPVTSAQILGAQVLGGALTVILQVLVLILVGTQLFGAKNHGSWPVAAVPVLLGTAAFVGVGFLLTSAARTSESARGLAALVAFPMMFLSGIFFPITSLPQALQTVIHILPLTWLTDALRQVMNDGAGLDAIAADCLVLAGWAVVTLTVAVWRFRWD